MNNIRIEAVGPDKGQGVFNVHMMAFGREGEANLVLQLFKKETFIPELSIAAFVENQLVGHVLFTPLIIVDGENTKYPSLCLAPLGVLPEFQNRGIGSALVAEGMKKAAELGHKTVVVLGEPAFYHRFGFVSAIKYDIRAPFDVPEGALMVAELVKDGIGAVAGVINFPDEFYF